MKDKLMKTTFLVAAIAAGMTLAATAEARDGRGPRPEMPSFEELDLNTDGGVTLEELEAAMEVRAEARFAEADSNGDGALSAEEMLAAAQGAQAERMQARIAERIEHADTNGDGLLQAEEMAEARAEHEGRGRRGPSPERMFSHFDADEDGVLNAEEFEEARARMQERGGRGRHGGN